MAIDDYKVTNAEVQAAHVQAAPNTLTGTAQENKAVFDGYPELLKEKHNNLIDAIDDALSEKADSSDVEAALAEKADIDDVDTALAEKVDKIEGKGLSANDYTDADKALVGTITNKVDKETGKGLSSNDYTTAEKTKLAGIGDGAEANVQSDWSQTDTTSDDYIKNKPSVPSVDSTLSTSGAAADAKVTGDEITGVKSDIIYNNNGKQTFKGMGNFQHYGLNPDGSFLTSQKYRVSNDDQMTFDYPITISVTSGFRYGYIPIYEGTAGSWLGWYTSDITIPYGVSFVLQIARTSEITSETANVDEFLSAISFTAKDQYLLNEFENRKNGVAIRDFNSFAHERGQMTSTGGNDEGEYNKQRKIRSTDLVYLNKGDVITASNSMRCYAVGVSLFGTAENTQSGWITSSYTMPYSGFYRLQIGLVSDSVIQDKDITKVCGWVTITSNWLLGDSEVYKYFNDTLTSGRKFTYDGDLLNFNKTSYNITEVLPVLPSLPSGASGLQASEYYNGVLFLFYNPNIVVLVDYETSSVIATLTTGTEHANSASFSNEFYDPNDEFPLVYVGSDNENNDIYIVRITRTSATIIKTLRIPVSVAGYHASNCGLDVDNNVLVTTGYKINDYQTPTNNGMYLCMWDLNALTDNGNGTYTPSLKEKTELPFINTTQDEKVFNGNLYVISSNPYVGTSGYTGPTSKIYVISLNGKRISAILDTFNEPIREHELEGIIFIERGNKYVMGINAITGRRFELTF